MIVAAQVTQLRAKARTGQPNTTMTWLSGRGADPRAWLAREAEATVACSRAGAGPEPAAAPGAMVVDMADAPFLSRAGQPRLDSSAGEVAD